MAARPTWKGYLKLSLVSCPVRLYNAVARSAKASFHLLHKRTRNRIQMRPHDPELGAVERSDLVKGISMIDTMSSSATRTSKVTKLNR